MATMSLGKLLAVGSLLLGPASVLALSCANLTALQGVADVESWIITSAETDIMTNKDLSYCNVSAVIGGRIRAWMLLPGAEEWNGRFVQIGCGGACGYNPFDSTYFDIDGALSNGSALSTTDMGVPDSSNNYAPMHNNLQMRIDWGFLATHLTAVMSKEVIKAYYGEDPTYSYHLGSSTGGRQSLVEAQRFPEDFNGVFAIAPAYNETGVTTFSIAWTARAALLDETNFTAAITETEAELLHATVIADCDGLDGIVDGIISLPRLCHPDFDRLLCSSYSSSNSSSNSSCISQMGLEAAKKIYSGPISSLTGEKQVPEGLLPGSEDAWVGTYIATTPGEPSAWYSFSMSFLSYFAFWPDPIDPVTPFSVNLSDPSLLRQTSKTESLEYGGVADMTKFKLLGGKIIMTGGLQDVAVAPCFPLDLWNRVGTVMGEGDDGRDGFMKFFELPGVNHVSGGPGADTYDALGYLVDWVENGVNPDMMIASHLDDNGTVEFTRPLYVYPMVAGYNGTGNNSSWESYVPINGSVSFWNL